MKEPNINILDCSTRLPGPFATSLLADLDYNVVKWEQRPDPFKLSELPEFRAWYQELNLKKTIIIGDGLPDQVLESTDIAINPPANLNFLKDKKILKVYLRADPKESHLHDINALAITGLLEIALSINKSIPFVPIGGLFFGHSAALNIVHHYYNLKEGEHKKIDLFLTDPLKKLKTVLFSDQLLKSKEKFLHNGLYPCYNAYQTADQGWLVIAATEEKPFKKLISLLKITLEGDQRFNQDLIELLADTINKKTNKELETLIKDQKILSTLIKKE